MIAGNGERKIKEYRIYDEWVSPGPDEEFWGIPYAWYSDNSYPFVEIRIAGKVVRTINALNVSEIVFE